MPAPSSVGSRPAPKTSTAPAWPGSRSTAPESTRSWALASHSWKFWAGFLTALIMVEPAPAPNGHAKPSKAITRVPPGTISPFVDRVLAAKPGLRLDEIKAQAKNAFERQISVAGISNHLRRNPLKYRQEGKRWYMVANAAERAMLERYAVEFRHGSFGIYQGNEITGKVRRVTAS